MAIPAYRQIPGTEFVVDAFRYRPILKEKTYFLTHAHSDHYGGLMDNWPGGPIHCSEVTAGLVHLLTGVPTDLLRPTPLDVTTLVDGVRVTFIDANHCPGAAQVLFELPDGRRYIHCGDMRYSPQLLDNPHLQRFKNADAVFLDTTYAHPRHTFPAQEEAVEFVAARIHTLLQEDAAGNEGTAPSMAGALQDMCTAAAGSCQEQKLEAQQLASYGQQPAGCQDQTQQQVQQQQQEQASLEPLAVAQPAVQQELQLGGSEEEEQEEAEQQGRRQLGFRRLYLISTYVIGKERLLLAVAARTGRKLLVTQRKLRLLRATGLSAAEIDAAFTTDPTSTPIRVVRWGHLGDTWPYFRPHFTNMEADRTAAGAQQVVGFVPTGWTYEMRKAAAAGGPDSCPVRIKGACSVWLVPYSEHSSFNELREYVGFIRPKQIIPTVGVGSEGPEGDKKNNAILKHFRGLLDETANKAAFIARLAPSTAAAAAARPAAAAHDISNSSNGLTASTAGAALDVVDLVDCACHTAGAVAVLAPAGATSAPADLQPRDEGFWELPAGLSAATCEAALLEPAARAGSANSPRSARPSPGGHNTAGAAAAVGAAGGQQQRPAAAAAAAADSARGAVSSSAAAAAAVSPMPVSCAASEEHVQLLQSLVPAGSLNASEAQQLLAAASGDLNRAVNRLLDQHAQQQPQHQRSVGTAGGKKRKSASCEGKGAGAAGADASSNGTNKKARQQHRKASPSVLGQAAITAFFASSRSKSRQPQQQHQQVPSAPPQTPQQQTPQQCEQQAHHEHQQGVQHESQTGGVPRALPAVVAGGGVSKVVLPRRRRQQPPPPPMVQQRPQEVPATQQQATQQDNTQQQQQLEVQQVVEDKHAAQVALPPLLVQSNLGFKGPAGPAGAAERGAEGAADGSPVLQAPTSSRVQQGVADLAPPGRSSAATAGSLSITSNADVVPAALRQAPLLPLQRYHPVDHAVWGPGQPAPYLALALTLAAVDGTTKRNQIALGMTNFFRSLMLLSPQDVVPAAYLLCGRIGPEYAASLELNIGGSVVSSALYEVCGVSRNQLRDLYKQHGDLGDVAQACRRRQTLLQAPQPLTIAGFFDALHKLAGMSGQGATARRQATVARLLRAARDVETRYLVRTLIQCLRVGAGYRSVLPPLAKAALLHRSMLAEAESRADAEHAAPPGGPLLPLSAVAAYAASSCGRVNKVQLDGASAAVLAAYHRCPNIQVIADVLLSSGPEALEARVQLSCGVPVKPMLARPCSGAADALKLLAGTVAAGAAAAAKGRVNAAATAAEDVPADQLQHSGNGEEGDEAELQSEGAAGAVSDDEDDGMGAAAAATGQRVDTSTQRPPKLSTSPAVHTQTARGIADSSSSSFSVLAEYKYDGQRAQIHISAEKQVHIFSRNCDENTGAFPDVCEAVLAAVDQQQLPVVLDAELVAVDRADGNRFRAFQELATRRRGSAAATAAAAAAGSGATVPAGTEDSTGAKRPAAAAGLGSSGAVKKAQQQKLRLQAAPSSSWQQSSTATDATAASTAAARLEATGNRQQQGSSSGAAAGSGQVQSAQVDVCVFVFDALCVAGRDLMTHSLRDRRAAAAAVLTHLTPGVVQLAHGVEVQVGRPAAVAAGPTHMLHGAAGAATAGSLPGAAAGIEPADAMDASSTGTADTSSSSRGTWATAEQQLTSFLFTALDAGCEGLMLKLLDGAASGYTPAQRGLSWLKLKRDYLEGLADSLDLVPIGAWHGQGRKVKWFSPFLLAVYDRETETFQSLCRCMSGFTDEFYAAAKERLSATIIPGPKPYYNTGESPSVWFEPTEVWEVRGADLSISPVHRAALGRIHADRGISLRFPRFLRVRADKSPEEASGPDLVQELYNKQNRRVHQD